MSCVSAVNLAALNDNENLWLVDCASTDYICNSEGKFMSLNPASGFVKMGNGKVPMTGVGTVRVELTKDCGGCILELHDVLLVPNFDYNLLSSSKLASKGINYI